MAVTPPAGSASPIRWFGKSPQGRGRTGAPRAGRPDGTRSQAAFVRLGASRQYYPECQGDDPQGLLSARQLQSARAAKGGLRRHP